MGFEEDCLVRLKEERKRVPNLNNLGLIIDLPLPKDRGPAEERRGEVQAFIVTAKRV